MPDRLSTTSQMTVSAQTVINGQFLLLVLGLLALTTGSLFLGGATDFLLFFVGFPLLATSAVVVLAGALWRPRWRKLFNALVTLSAGVEALTFIPDASRLGRHLFFVSRRDGLEAFEEEIRAFGRIHSMSDGTRHYKDLNGALIAYEAATVGTIPGVTAVPTLPLADVLARDDIPPAKYDEFRKRLIRLKFIQFQVEPDYVAFLHDGLLDNLYGLMHVRPGRKPPRLHSELFAAELVSLRPLGDGWFWFGTT